MHFQYEGYDFEGRKNEVNNIVWLTGQPDNSYGLPRSFTFEEVADAFLVANELPFYQETA